MSIKRLLGISNELLKVQQARVNVNKKTDAEIAKEMPTAIEIDHKVGKVGIVHAEVFKDWEIFKNRLNEHHIYMMTIWGRSRLYYKDETFVENVSRIYVGQVLS